MNTGKITLFGLSALCALGMYAVPAKKGDRTFTQADGSAITLRLIGDEHFHTFMTADGLAVGRGSDGSFYYRSADGALTSVMAHTPADRTDGEISFINANIADIKTGSLVAANRKRIQARRARKASGAKAAATQVPNTGSPRIPILLVQYADYKFKDADPKDTFNKFFAEGETSAYRYFVDQSDGAYTPQFDVYGPVTLSGNRKVYGGNDYYGDDKGVGKMVGEGCQLLSGEIDFSKYDNDGDGECDVVIVLYAGDGEASSYEDDCEDAVWPCQWELSNSDYGRALNLNNTKVDKFAVFNELNGTDISRIDGIGTFCHEFSHCLGLPDFYDTEYGPHFGMGPWSLMDYGSYNDDGYTPIGYSAYEKNFMGWLKFEEGAEDTFYTLNPLNSGKDGVGRAVRLTNPADGNEYYVLENRACEGWDKYMATDGLFIYHVTYSPTAWFENEVNNYSLQRMTPVPADNDLKLNTVYTEDGVYYDADEESLLGDMWPWNGNDALTDTSAPAAKVNTGSLLGKPVTHIVRNTDGTVSFWVMKAPLPAVAAPVEVSHSVESNGVATVSWAAGDANDVTYTLEIAPHRDINYDLVLSTEFNSNNHGWETDGFADYESVENAVRLGSNKQIGMLTSPSFTLSDDGLATVTVEAKYYSGDESSINVCLLDASGYEVESKEVDLTAAFDSYTVLLEGAPGAGAMVCIETVAKKKRAYVRSAMIYTGDATEAEAATRALAPASKRVIEGIVGTSVKVDGLEPGAVYDYRLMAVPVDEEAYDRSSWTEKYLLDLTDLGMGISSLPQGEAGGREEWFTLDGVRLQGVPAVPGLYLHRSGGRVVKILVK